MRIKDGNLPFCHWTQSAVFGSGGSLTLLSTSFIFPTISERRMMPIFLLLLIFCGRPYSAFLIPFKRRTLNFSGFHIGGFELTSQDGVLFDFLLGSVVHVIKCSDEVLYYGTYIYRFSRGRRSVRKKTENRRMKMRRLSKMKCSSSTPATSSLL